MTRPSPHELFAETARLAHRLHWPLETISISSTQTGAASWSWPVAGPHALKPNATDPANPASRLLARSLRLPAACWRAAGASRAARGTVAERRRPHVDASRAGSGARRRGRGACSRRGMWTSPRAGSSAKGGPRARRSATARRGPRSRAPPGRRPSWAATRLTTARSGRPSRSVQRRAGAHADRGVRRRRAQGFRLSSTPARGTRAARSLAPRARGRVAAPPDPPSEAASEPRRRCSRPRPPIEPAAELDAPPPFRSAPSRWRRERRGRTATPSPVLARTPVRATVARRRERGAPATARLQRARGRRSCASPQPCPPSRPGVAPGRGGAVPAARGGPAARHPAPRAQRGRWGAGDPAQRDPASLGTTASAAPAPGAAAPRRRPRSAHGGAPRPAPRPPRRAPGRPRPLARAERTACAPRAVPGGRRPAPSLAGRARGDRRAAGGAPRRDSVHPGSHSRGGGPHPLPSLRPSPLRRRHRRRLRPGGPASALAPERLRHRPQPPASLPARRLRAPRQRAARRTPRRLVAERPAPGGAPALRTRAPAPTVAPRSIARSASTDAPAEPAGPTGVQPRLPPRRPCRSAARRRPGARPAHPRAARGRSGRAGARVSGLGVHGKRACCPELFGDWWRRGRDEGLVAVLLGDARAGPRPRALAGGACAQPGSRRCPCRGRLPRRRRDDDRAAPGAPGFLAGVGRSRRRHVRFCAPSAARAAPRPRAGGPTGRARLPARRLARALGLPLTTEPDGSVSLTLDERSTGTLLPVLARAEEPDDSQPAPGRRRRRRPPTPATPRRVHRPRPAARRRRRSRTSTNTSSSACDATSWSSASAWAT